MVLKDPITILPFVGRTYATKLDKLGIETVQDLLFFFPRTYQDTRLITQISELNDNTKSYSILATVNSIKNIRTRTRGLTIQKANVSDDTGDINITWFNQPFLPKNLKEGSVAYFSGKLNPRSLIPELISPTYDVVNDAQINLARIVPIYPLTSGISSKWLRRRIFELVELIASIKDFKDSLPKKMKEKYDLIELEEAIKEVHFPKSKETLVNARKRLSFDELLEIQIKLLAARRERESVRVAPWKIVAFEESPVGKGIDFKLTPSQNAAIKDISQDLSSGHVMYRLLEGDVGSGKTLVAFHAAQTAIHNGFQSVILAPTSVLAEQHYKLALKLFSKSTKIGLITSETTKKMKSPPKLDLIIGTHAVFFHQEKLFKKLGLIIVDEEHRFGVAQRNEIQTFYKKLKGETPHYLSLTATPIPRSIALTLFGDLDVSSIEKPPGRKTVKTFLVPQIKRKDSIGWLKDKMKSGSQIFWICPLIEDNPDLEAKSVKALFEQLVHIFPPKSVRLLHGKMKSDEKNKIIADFKSGEFQILLSTTVIEVGIDIPGADIVVIENADRFGLAQLHQLRGRVGRNNQDSWCLLFTTIIDERGIGRLKYFASNNNGISIAEFDLKQRGPGEVYGNIQSGIPNLKIARFSNSDLLLQTREAALQLV